LRISFKKKFQISLLFLIRLLKLDDINFDTVYDIAFGKAIVLEHRHDDHENLETKRKI
jgi:hypothetical protein